jgi:hypothetical protein
MPKSDNSPSTPACQAGCPPTACERMSQRSPLDEELDARNDQDDLDEALEVDDPLPP